MCNNKGITNSGRTDGPGASIAIDSKYWPFGTFLYKGLGIPLLWMETGER